VLDFTAATGTGTFTTYDSGNAVISTTSTSGAIISLPSNGAYFIIT
jgi:hypothetical protein